MMSTENTEKAEERPTINRSYDIYKDQNDWLVNTPFNKSGLIRTLLDNFINDIDKTVIQNLKDENIRLNDIIKYDDEQYVNQVRELMEKIESQKAVIVALGGEE